MTDAEIESRIKELKKYIVQIAFDNQEGHIPTAFSIMDILYVLYHDIMNIDPQNPQMEHRDRLIVSKGHASIGIYAILADRGYFPLEELKTFCKYGSRLGGHPDFHKVPGIEVSTGSLGHGLPLAVGMGMGLKFKGFQDRIFVITGDAEMNEGTNWEAIMVAKEQKLDNLTCIVDYNHSTDRAVDFGDFEAKFRDFGWNTCSVTGHDLKALREVLGKKTEVGKPLAVIANTVKGKGCKMIENNPAWHHRSPNADELKHMLEEIDNG